MNATAYAQQAAEDSASDAEPIAEITVTGSRIKRAGFDTLQPATVVSADALADRGVVSLGDALKDVPAFGLPTSGAGGQSTVQVGQSFVNFFGLGSQRTLTLVDGRRFVASNSPAVNSGSTPGLQVDLNSIPVGLVERIETIATGGAPTYGADAIAGTVNVILKKNFEGLSSEAQVGITDQGGARRERIQGLYGVNFADGRGNIAINLEFNSQQGLKGTDRGPMAESLSFQRPHPSDPRISQFGQVLIRDSHVVFTTNNGIPLRDSRNNFAPNGTFGNQINVGSTLMQFSPHGQLVPFNPGTPTGDVVRFSGGDGLFLAETQTLLSDSERKLGNVFLNFALTDALRLHAEGWFAQSESVAVANQASYNERSFIRPTDRPGRIENGALPIRLDNPYLSAQARSVIDNAIAPGLNIDFDGDGVNDTRGFWLSKAHQDLYGGSQTVAEQTLYRSVVGLDGSFDLGGRELDWDVSLNYGRSKGESKYPGMLKNEFNLALDAVTDPLTGQIRCRDSSAAGCVPLNVFGFGHASPQARSYVVAMPSTQSEIEQQVAAANVTGSLFTLPGGDVGFALGIEHRRESSEFSPDAISTSGRLRGAPLTGLKGEFDTSEIYAETVIPIIGASQGIPAIHMLEFEGAVRYVDHSTAGEDMTWTAGLRFAPVRDVTLRGNLTESIRAPAITELFLPTAQITAFAQDPCDARFIDQGANKERRAANCAATGITQPFTSLIVSASQPTTIEGNRSLKNEQAESWTVGAVIQPRFMPGFSLAVDWVEIDLKDAIERLDGTTIMQACYDSANFPTAEVCQRFNRNASNQVTSMRTGYLNAGLRTFSGLTANMSYDIPLESGHIGLGLGYFYLDTLDTSVTGTDFNPEAGERNFSRNRGTASITYSGNKLRGMLQGQYIGKAVFDRTDSFDVPGRPDTRDVRGIEDFLVFNTSVGYTITDRIGLQLNVDNLLEEEPPYGALAGTIGLTANGATATYFSGIMGRTYSLTARASF